MRKFRTGFRRRRRPPTSWLASPQGYTPDALLAVPANTLTLVQLASAQLGAQTAQPSIERFKIERIVGDITWRFLSNAGAANSLWLNSFGIYIGDEAQGAQEAKNPNIGAGAATTDSEASWLWLHHWTSESQSTACDSNSVDSATYHRIHVDVRVKRILRNKQVLLFASFPHVLLNAAASLQTQFALRTLISKVV